MNIVLDTNVLVAGLLSPSGPCGEIVRMVSSGELTLLLDVRILSEYGEVLRRPKFRFDPDKVTALLEYIRLSGIIVPSYPLMQSLPDRDDEVFLETALSGSAACLVTGNQIHFPATLRQGIQVLSPREFIEFYTLRQKTE